MRTKRGSESESDDECMDSVADPADLEERSRSSDRASPRTPLDTESGRGRAVSDGLGPTPDAGSVGARCRAHVSEQPRQTIAKEREVTPTDARFRHIFASRVQCRPNNFIPVSWRRLYWLHIEGQMTNDQKIGTSRKNRELATYYLSTSQPETRTWRLETRT
jgi:hypothetical protein